MSLQTLSRHNDSGSKVGQGGLKCGNSPQWGASEMLRGATKLESKLAKWRAWGKENWQVLLFWLACAFAGWYLGAKGYRMALYFRLTGIDPEEWTPLMRLTAQKDPKVGTIVSLEGLTNRHG
jgi:hypothetical protein